MSDIINEVQNAPDTFSSWDKCMDKAYCKWPAIVGIVLGSLILLSVLFCLVQCLCCGVSCAKMLCCCCRGCGRGSRSKNNEKPSRFQDNYQQMPPTPYTGYQPSPNPMSYRGAPATATFDANTGRKINEDSLPAMPSWDTAQTRRVEETLPEKPHGEDVEMGHLAPIATQQRTGRNGYNAVPTGPISPTSPTYSQNSYFAAHPQNPNQHLQNSDLGAQRMGSYNGYDEVPHSPAPTYATNPPPATDRFVAGAASAVPYSYQKQRDNQSDMYTPSSTQYQASDYSHPNTFHQQPSSYQPHMTGGRPLSFASSPYGAPSPYSGHRSISPPQDQGSARPPSLLQIGRKAIPGSTREV